MRGLCGAILIALLIAGCGTPPQPTDPLAALGAWPPSAQIGAFCSDITATYENWPLPAPPRVFACARPPARVFGDPPSRELLLPRDPGCVPFAVTQAGRQLQLRLERVGLPAAFDGVQAWTVILAVDLEAATWQATTTLPIVGPGIPVLPAPSRGVES